MAAEEEGVRELGGWRRIQGRHLRLLFKAYIDKSCRAVGVPGAIKGQHARRFLSLVRETFAGVPTGQKGWLFAVIFCDATDEVVEWLVRRKRAYRKFNSVGGTHTNHRWRRCAGYESQRRLEGSTAGLSCFLEKHYSSRE
jgi:hypothetical protein